MSWNKGFSKETHVSVAKISTTMKERKIDNFREWRKQHIVNYVPFIKNGDLAEYIGVVLGDGHIEAFPRTERLIIVGDAKKMGFIYNYAELTETLFKKKPIIKKVSTSNGVRISIYQKYISTRLGVPTGNRSNYQFILPQWIEQSNYYSIRFLRGMFEAEGSLSIHLPTCTYNFSFSNYNKYLLNAVEDCLWRLEFHPEIRNNAIRIRSKLEVEKLRKLISFREY